MRHKLFNCFRYSSIFFLSSIACVVIFASTLGALHCMRNPQLYQTWEQNLFMVMGIVYIILNFWIIMSATDQQEGIFALFWISIFAMIFSVIGLYGGTLFSTLFSEANLEYTFNNPPKAIHWNLAPRIIVFYFILGIIVDLFRFISDKSGVNKTQHREQTTSSNGASHGK